MSTNKTKFFWSFVAFLCIPYKRDSEEGTASLIGVIRHIGMTTVYTIGTRIKVKPGPYRS